MKRAIDVRRTQGLNAALAAINSERGKAEMDAIPAVIARMGREEAVLRAPVSPKWKPRRVEAIASRDSEGVEESASPQIVRVALQMR